MIAYFSNMWDTAAAGAHPEWLARSVRSPGDGALARSLCRSGYRRYALDQVREIAQRYPIDGLWSDILTAGPCACARCEAAFVERYGHSMPASPEEDGWIEMIHFYQDLLYDYLVEQRAVLRQERPAAALIPNFYATAFVDAALGLSARHLALADIGSTEGYTDWHGPRFPSFAASSIRAGVEYRPSEVLVSRFVHTWDFTLRSPAHLRFQAFSAAAHGCTVTVGRPAVRDRSDGARGLRASSARVHTHRRACPLARGALPYRYTALYASQTSRELESLLGGAENASDTGSSRRDSPRRARSTPSDLVAALSGSYVALVESHLPVELVDERQSQLEALTDYRVLLLADVLALSGKEVDAVERFVHGGGGLVITGPVGVRELDGTELTCSRLEGLLGLRFGARGQFSYPYLKLADPALAARLRHLADPPLRANREPGAPRRAGKRARPLVWTPCSRPTSTATGTTISRRRVPIRATQS